MSGLPTLTTRHLTLRPLDPSLDTEPILSLGRDPEVSRFLNDGRPMSCTDVEEFLERHLTQYPAGRGFAAVIERETGAFAGWAGVQVPRRWMAKVVDCPLDPETVEVGWTLVPESRGNGYATEAADAWIDHGFGTLGLTEIIAVHDPANTASERVMNRLGMARRDSLTLNDGDTLCLRALDAGAWSLRARAHVALGYDRGAVGKSNPRTSGTPTESGATS